MRNYEIGLFIKFRTEAIKRTYERYKILQKLVSDKICLQVNSLEFIRNREYPCIMH